MLGEMYSQQTHKRGFERMLLLEEVQLGTKRKTVQNEVWALDMQQCKDRKQAEKGVSCKGNFWF